MEKKLKKRAFLLSSVILLLMFSTGCSQTGEISQSYRAIDRLKLVHTLGFDPHPDGVELSVCAGESENKDLLRLHSHGSNISQGVSRLQEFAGKEELYYAHTRYVLVGEDYAKDGLEALLEYLESTAQLRTDLPLFIVKGGTAKDLVLKGGGEDMGIFEQLDAVMRDCTKQGTGYAFSCGDIGSISGEFGSALACAVTVKDTGSTDPSAAEDAVTPVSAGYGVLKEGKLVGYIPPSAAPAVNFLLAQPGTEGMTVSVSGRPVSLRITKAEPNLLPDFHRSGALSALTVQLHLEVTLQEAEDKEKLDLTRLQSAYARLVQGQLNEVLQVMRSTQSDFLGFFPDIAMHHPAQYARSPIRWSSQLKTLPMEAEVSCTFTLGEHTPPQ